MQKRIISLLLVFVLLITLIPASLLTVEAASPPSDTDLYYDFIQNLEYAERFEANSSFGPAEKFAFADINNDDVKELIISGTDDYGFSTNDVYTLSEDKTKVVFLKTIDCWADLRYSPEYKALRYSPYKLGLQYGTVQYNSLIDGTLAPVMVLEYSVSMTDYIKRYYQHTTDTEGNSLSKIEITDTQWNALYDETISLEWNSLYMHPYAPIIKETIEIHNAANPGINRLGNGFFRDINGDGIQEMVMVYFDYDKEFTSVRSINCRIYTMSGNTVVPLMDEALCREVGSAQAEAMLVTTIDKEFIIIHTFAYKFDTGIKNGTYRVFSLEDLQLTGDVYTYTEYPNEETGGINIIQSTATRNGESITYSEFDFVKRSHNVFCTATAYSNTDCLTLPEMLEYTKRLDISEYRIEAYTQHPEYTIGINQNTPILFRLFNRDKEEMITNYTLEIANPEIVSKTDVEHKEGYYIITFTGLKAGSTTISFTDDSTNTTVTLPITVDKSSEYHRCSLSVKEYLTNGHIVYIDQYSCTENPDGTHRMSFDAYNTSYAYGAVVAFDPQGKLIQHIPINPRSDGSGTELIINNFRYIWNDISNKGQPWYREMTQSKHTFIELDNLPENAEVIITCDAYESIYPTFYTGLQIFVQGILTVSQINADNQTTQLVLSELIKRISDDLPESVLKSTIDALPSLTGGVSIEKFTEIYETYYDLFIKIGTDVEELLQQIVNGLVYEALDTVLVTVLPVYDAIIKIESVLELVYPAIHFELNQKSGKIEFHITSHNQSNWLANGSVSVSNVEGISSDTVLDSTVIEDISTVEGLQDILNSADKDYTVYNLIMRENSEEIQPQNTVEVKVPADSEESRVYSIDENNTLTDMNAVFEDGYLKFTAASLGYFAVASEKETPDFSLGDFNMDTKVNIKDATLIQKYIAGMVEIDESVLPLADTTKDGKVNIRDATLLQKFIAGIVDTL